MVPAEEYTLNFIVSLTSRFGTAVGNWLLLSYKSTRVRRNDDAGKRKAGSRKSVLFLIIKD